MPPEIQFDARHFSLRWGFQPRLGGPERPPYCSTIVICETRLMNGEKLAVRPKRSVAVTV